MKSKMNPGADISADLVVLGGGPGGYTAAFRAADLGQKVVLVEQYERLGGVCLNAGCIPSKALLHSVKVLEEARGLSHLGMEFAEPKISIDKLRAWKDGVVGKLVNGLAGLARQRNVQIVKGEGRFAGPNLLEVPGAGRVGFRHAIIAVGSSPARLPFLSDDPRVMDSTGALTLADIPGRLLIVGGGIIGLEMATVYSALGSRVSLVELTNGILPGCDRDLVAPLEKRISSRYEAVLLNTTVTDMGVRDKGIQVSFEGGQAPEPQIYDRVLVTIGRRPNGGGVAAEKAGIHVDGRGFIPVDRFQRTNVPHILAIGDVAGEPMLAHKAAHEGKVAAEVVAGHKVSNHARVIPAVAYTDPEVAWVGLTETEAAQRDIPYEKAVFPWKASGRALTLERDEGITKILVDPKSRFILGAGIVGPHAGELIAEAALAIEMCCEPGDLRLTVHPHPTLSETLASAAEVYDGTITELFSSGKRGAHVPGRATGWQHS